MYYSIAEWRDHIYYNPTVVISYTHNEAKQCSLIAIDEIRDNLPLISDIQEYWQEVKQEIEKL